MYLRQKRLLNVLLAQCDEHLYGSEHGENENAPKLKVQNNWVVTRARGPDALKMEAQKVTHLP